jgi:hypothetical protein
VNEQGLVEVVSADIPRFDHEYDASTGVIKSLGLLVEEQRSNLFNHTEDFTQLPVSGIQDGWFRGRVILTTESVTAPDGSSGVSLLTEDNASFGEHYVTQEGFNYTSGVTYTWSWYVKPNGRDNVYCKVYTNFNDTQLILNLETSSEYYLTGTTFDNITNTKLPNGWYRVSFTSTAISTGAGSVLLGFAQSETVRSYTGDGSSGMYYWGAQVEAGAFPTSYIPNGTDSQATRNPDNVTMTGDNFSDWYNQSEGTVYADTRMVGAQTGRYDRLWAITNSDFNFQGIGLYIEGPSGSLVYVNTITSSTGTLEYGSRNTLSVPDISSSTTPELKSTLTYSQNYANTSFNGFIGSADTSVNLITADRLFIGQPQRFQGYSCMTVSQLTYYPRRLSNDNLQNLTK